MDRKLQKSGPGKIRDKEKQKRGPQILNKTKQNKVTVISKKFVLNPHHIFKPSWKSNACIELTEFRNWRSSRRRGGLKLNLSLISFCLKNREPCHITTLKRPN